MPSVLLVDDHLIVRRGLSQLLEEELRIQVFGEARTADEALAELTKRVWDLIILDIGIPGRDGFQLLEEMRGKCPEINVLVLSIHSEPPYAARARRLGALGFISKDASRAELVRAFRTVLDGRKYFPQLPAPAASAELPDARKLLSEREFKVMLALAAGQRISDIAAGLDLSVKTVSTYKHRVLHKLGLHSTADIVRYVIDRGLS